MLRDDIVTMDMVRQARTLKDTNDIKEFIVGDVDVVHTSNMTTKIMYNYLSGNKPVMIQDHAKNWKGLSKWKDSKYLITQMKIAQAINMLWRKDPTGKEHD